MSQRPEPLAFAASTGAADPLEAARPLSALSNASTASSGSELELELTGETPRGSDATRLQLSVRPPTPSSYPTQGDFVWAKQRGEREWPAQVAEPSTTEQLLQAKLLQTNATGLEEQQLFVLYFTSDAELSRMGGDASWEGMTFGFLPPSSVRKMTETPRDLAGLAEMVTDDDEYKAAVLSCSRAPRDPSCQSDNEASEGESPASLVPAVAPSPAALRRYCRTADPTLLSPVAGTMKPTDKSGTCVGSGQRPPLHSPPSAADAKPGLLGAAAEEPPLQKRARVSEEPVQAPLAQ